MSNGIRKVLAPSRGRNLIQRVDQLDNIMTKNMMKNNMQQDAINLEVLKNQNVKYMTLLNSLNESRKVMDQNLLEKIPEKFRSPEAIDLHEVIMNKGYDNLKEVSAHMKENIVALEASLECSWASKT